MPSSGVCTEWVGEKKIGCMGSVIDLNVSHVPWVGVVEVGDLALCPTCPMWACGREEGARVASP